MAKKLFGMFPDVKGISDMMTAKFDEMMVELRAIRAASEAMLAELRTQRGAS